MNPSQLIEAYLADVHQRLREEARYRLEERIGIHIDSGATEDEAVTMAIEEAKDESQ